MSATAVRLPPLPSVRDLLLMYGIRAKKSLSQNFIMDPRINTKIANCAGQLKDKFVVEIGPGPGGITRALLAGQPSQVVVIEKDRRFIPSLQLLQEAAGGPSKLQIHIGDVLNFNIAKLFPEEVRRDWDSPECPPAWIVGNLPFNVSTPLLIKMLFAMSTGDNFYSFGRVPAVLTFQYEVAARMTAQPESPNRSRLSVMCQNYAQVELLATLPGKAFVPMPQVDVSLVRMTPWRKAYICDADQKPLPFKVVNQIVTALFHGKQKFIKNSISSMFMNQKDKSFLTQTVLSMADVGPNRTAISLSMEEIDRICTAVMHLTSGHQLHLPHLQPQISITDSILEPTVKKRPESKFKFEL